MCVVYSCCSTANVLDVMLETYITVSSPCPTPPPCPAQVSSQSKKDATTYWGWEGQPKAWGYSSEGSGKPRPLVGKEEVMRDRTWFKSATTSERAPTKAASVPHR